MEKVLLNNIKPGFCFFERVITRRKAGLGRKKKVGGEVEVRWD